MPAGRPTKYTKQLAAKICEQLSLGRSLRSVCKSDDMPSISSVFNWFDIYPEFVEQYERAKQESADSYADEIVDIADNEAVTDLIIDGVPVLDPETNQPYQIVTATGVQHARLKIDARKWVSSKLKPKKYGDKVTNEHQALNQKGEPTKWQVEFVNADLNKEGNDE